MNDFMIIDFNEKKGKSFERVNRFEISFMS